MGRRLVVEAHLQKMMMMKMQKAKVTTEKAPNTLDRREESTTLYISTTE